MLDFLLQRILPILPAHLPMTYGVIDVFIMSGAIAAQFSPTFQQTFTLKTRGNAGLFAPAYFADSAGTLNLFGCPKSSSNGMGL